jgi:hypothetical protein
MELALRRPLGNTVEDGAVLDGHASVRTFGSAVASHAFVSALLQILCRHQVVVTFVQLRRPRLRVYVV